MAQILDVSQVTVLKLHGRFLHPTKNADGVYEYEREDVMNAVREYKRVRRAKNKDTRVKVNHGRNAAEAMRLFIAGASLTDVVIALNVTPQQARAWYDDYKYGFEGKPKPLIIRQYIPILERPEPEPKIKKGAPLRKSTPLPTQEKPEPSPASDPAHESKMSEFLTAFRPKKEEPTQ